MPDTKKDILANWLHQGIKHYNNQGFDKYKKLGQAIFFFLSKLHFDQAITVIDGQPRHNSFLIVARVFFNPKANHHTHELILNRTNGWI